MKLIRLSKYITRLYETPDGTGSWFGYYNYDPLNNDQTKLLCHRTHNDAQIIRKGMSVEIGYYDIPSGDWHHVGISDSYNWPQGSMSQWLPGIGNENKIIYNLSDNSHLISRIYDISTGKSKDINWPIYGLTPDGKKSITIDLERSHFTLAYHYESITNEEKNKRVVPGDGIFEIDLEKNTRKCLIPIENIINIDYEPYFDKCNHWLEHVMISKNGKRFCFLHRFTPIGNANKRITRLFIADIDGSNLHIIKGWRDYSWSHFGWDGDDAFSIYTYERPFTIGTRYVMQESKQSIASSPNTNPLSRLLKLFPVDFRKDIRIRLKGQKSYYQYYIVKDGLFSLYENYKLRAFDIDGHQSYTNDGKYMITDSYPNGQSFQRLMVYNKSKRKALMLAHIYAGLNGKPGTCDLHPKLCSDNNFLIVDSAYNGRHHTILFRLNWDKINKYFQ